MKRSQPVGPWPERLLDDDSAVPLESRLAKDLQTVLRDGAPESFERVARRAARRTLAQLDARHSFGTHSALSWARFLLRPRLMLAAVGLALVLHFGGALAEELGPRAFFRLGDWIGREVTSFAKSPHWRGPAPTTEARREEAAEVRPSSGIPDQTAELAASPAPITALAGPPPLAPPLAMGGAMGGPVVRQGGALRSRRTREPVMASAPDPLGSEAAVVSRVVALAGTDSRGALNLLADYWRDYPRGALRGEAAVAEVSALQALGKGADALARLDGWARDAFHGMGQAGDELSLTRLELMVSAGRCAEALPLLEVSASEGPRRFGRALLARAACKGKLGDSDGNRADLERYLRELPDGPRATQVRRALAAGE